MATVGGFSWQVVREAKNAVSKIEIALSKIAKLPWANWNCREQIEIAVSKIEIALSKAEIAVTLLDHRM